MLFRGAIQGLQSVGEQARTMSDYDSSPTGLDRENVAWVLHLMALENGFNQTVPNTRSWGLNQALSPPAGHL